MKRPVWKNLLISLLFLTGLFSLGAQAGAGGEDAAGPAVLLQGPLPVKRLPFLGENAISASRGVYSYREARISVYHTETPVLIPQSWDDFSCSGTIFRRGSSGEETIYALEDPRGWTFFIVFPGGGPPACPFLNGFLGRFNYFRGSSGVFSFPAIIEFSL